MRLVEFVHNLSCSSARAFMALAPSAHTPRVQHSVYDVSASWTRTRLKHLVGIWRLAGTPGNYYYDLQESHSGGQDEFPGLAFGIKDMDQHQKFSSAGSSQDFPSLGSAAGGEGGPKPAGVWGRGAGHLAGESSSHTPWQTILLIQSSICILGRDVMG